jgi:hypothetical protein
MKPVHDRLRASADWRFLELPGGHDLMVTEPLRPGRDLLT